MKRFYFLLFPTLWLLLSSCDAPARRVSHALSVAADSSLFSDAEPSASSPTDRPSGKARRLEMPARLRGVPERIIEHTGYTLSYNREHHAPNWVAWELTADEAAGELPRDDDFAADPDVPASQRVEPADYRGSGYDRGHMVPAADMKWSAKAMRECFYMSNMCPQKHGLNAGPWAKLETACRRWASREGAVYIVCGPIYNKGGRRKTIGKSVKITVPDAFFKVVLCMKEEREKAIGFLYANRDGKQPMPAAACSVDSVEALTGIDFFVHLPDDVEERLESSYSFKRWQ